MKEIEKQIMISMVTILNEAKNGYCKGCPIMTDEMYDVRLKDLKQFEQETNFVLLNSPTQSIDLKSIVEDGEIIDCYKETNNVEEIVENLGKEKVIAYTNLIGERILVYYENGIVKCIQTKDVECLKQVDNIPYKISKEKNYSVLGVVACVDGKLKFFVDDVFSETGNSLNSNLEIAKDLGFDIVPNWLATDLNPKTLQKTVDYIFDYVKDDGLPCDGIIFMKDCYDGCDYQKVYKLNKGKE